MIIAIEKGLEKLKQQLEDKGYKCFYIGEDGIADAIIYKDKDNHPYFQVNNSHQFTSVNNRNAGTSGALLINAENKTIDEIIGILNRRTYSPLF